MASIRQRRSHRFGICTLVLASALAAASWVATGTAQSPNPFGTPSADTPQPGGTIKAVPGSRAQGWLGQGRSEVLARHGIVATSDPLAAQAGLEILRQGGNAIDAAVAAGAVLDVTSQNDTGIGGDLFALVYVGQRQEAVRARIPAGGRRPDGRRSSSPASSGRRPSRTAASIRRPCPARSPGTTRCSNASAR